MNTPPVETSFDGKAIPTQSNADWFDVSYRGPNTHGVSAYEDGEIVFSGPEVSKRNLFSRGYRICLALAGINQTTQQRVLAHICPGRYYPKDPRKFSTAFIRGHQHEIDENLKRWNGECGITNENMGMAGSCIFPTSKDGALAYLDTIKWMGDRLAAILPGDPQILGLPSKGDGSEQHIGVSDRVIIVRQPAFISAKIPRKHMPLKEIGGAINTMMKPYKR